MCACKISGQATNTPSIWGWFTPEPADGEFGDDSLLLGLPQPWDSNWDD